MPRLSRQALLRRVRVVDQVERLAIDRAKTLFKAEHANVQAHAGAQANFAAFMALARPGETLLAMSLPAWRAPDPRSFGKPQWSDLEDGALRRRSRDRLDRLRPGARPRPGAPAATDRRGRQCLFADHRFRRLPDHRRRGRRSRSWWIWRTSRAWWRAVSIPRRCRTPTW